MALVQQSTDVTKLKPATFRISSLRIGFYEVESEYPSHLEAKIYYARKKLIWEIMRNNVKDKIEIEWENISAIRASTEENSPDILEITVNKVPQFFHEVIDSENPKSHVKWTKSEDFTEDQQASKYRLHFLKFPSGVLKKHYTNLLRCDKDLLKLSLEPYPSPEDAYFDSDSNSNHGVQHLHTLKQQFIDVQKRKKQQSIAQNIRALLTPQHIANTSQISGKHIPIAEARGNR